MTARLLKTLLLFALGICLFQPLAAQLTVNPNTDPISLARIMTGYGVQVFNAQFTGGKFSAGSFQNSNNNLSLDSGIILTNGVARSQGMQTGADGFSTQIASNGLGLAGDALLEDLINNVAETNDACVLEFDFIPAGDSVSFKFVFASEEYPDYNCTPFSDLFAFVITGPGFPRGQNLALVPGTQVPVAINSINNGTPGPGGQLSFCQMLGPGSPFRNLYVDNSNANITYNGMTVTLNAGIKVTPCVTYHLKLAIADLSDDIMDSGVFIQANSFNSTFARFEYNGSRDANNKPYLVEGCDNGSLLKILYSSKVPAPTAVRLSFFGSTADPEVDVNPPLWEFQTFAANDSIISLPLSAIQDNLPEGLEKLVIKVAPMICGNGFDTDSIEIDIREFLELTINPPNPVVCEGNSIQLTANQPGLSNFNWSPRDYLSGFAISNPICTPLDTITYTVTGEFAPGCRAQGFVFVDIKSAASLALTKTDIGCIPNSGTITVQASSAWVNPEFSINGSPFSPGNQFTGLAPGHYIVDVRDATGCTAQKDITLIQLPALQITADINRSASCLGEDGEIKISGSGGQAPYLFSIDGINFIANSIFTITGGAQTVYVRDALNCVSSLAVTIPSDPPLVVNVEITPDSCRGQADGTIQLRASGGTGQFSYAINGGTPQSSSLFPVVAGQHNVTVEDNRGCRNALNVTVPLINNLFLDPGADTLVCEGTSVRMRAVTNATRFHWDPPTGLDDPLALNPSASPLSTTTYTLTAESGLCQIQDALTITFIRAPVTQAGPDQIICNEGETTISGTGNGLLSWQPTYLFANPSQPTQQVNPAQTTTYWLEAVNEIGCRSVRPDSVTITVLPPLTVNAGPDTIAAIGQTIQLRGQGSDPGDQFLWTPATGLSDPRLAEPLATITQDIIYSLRVTNAAGCTDTDTIKIRAFKGPEIYVPSAFTPNGDGKNDILRALPAGVQQFHYFRVYNRWGQLVFQTQDHRIGWDGRINGQIPPTATFVWVAEGTDYLGQRMLRKGTVVLIR